MNSPSFESKKVVRGEEKTKKEEPKPEEQSKKEENKPPEESTKKYVYEKKQPQPPVQEHTHIRYSRKELFGLRPEKTEKPVGMINFVKPSKSKILSNSHHILHDRIMQNKSTKTEADIKELLNKLCEQNKDKIIAKFDGIGITDPETQKIFLKVLFNKATTEEKWVKLYSSFFKEIFEKLEQENKKSLRKSLIDMCEELFKHSELEVNDKLEMYSEEQWKNTKKEEYLGNVRFAAQLYIVGILYSKVITVMIGPQLLETFTELSIEGLKILMITIYDKLMDEVEDKEETRTSLNKLFDMIQTKYDEKKGSKRINFFLLDVLELKNQNLKSSSVLKDVQKNFKRTHTPASNSSRAYSPADLNRSKSTMLQTKIYTTNDIKSYVKNLVTHLENDDLDDGEYDDYIEDLGNKLFVKDFLENLLEITNDSLTGKLEKILYKFFDQYGNKKNKKENSFSTFTIPQQFLDRKTTGLIYYIAMKYELLSVDEILKIICKKESQYFFLENLFRSKKKVELKKLFEEKGLEKYYDITKEQMYEKFNEKGVLLYPDEQIKLKIKKSTLRDFQRWIDENDFVSRSENLECIVKCLYENILDNRNNLSKYYEIFSDSLSAAEAGKETTKIILDNLVSVCNRKKLKHKECVEIILWIVKAETISKNEFEDWVEDVRNEKTNEKSNVVEYRKCVLKELDEH